MKTERLKMYRLDRLRLKMEQEQIETRASIARQPFRLRQKHEVDAPKVFLMNIKRRNFRVQITLSINFLCGFAFVLQMCYFGIGSYWE